VKSEAAASVVASLLTPPVADRPNCLRVPAPGQPRKLVLIGALDHSRGTPIVHRSPTGRSTDFIALFERLDLLCGPRPGQTRRRQSSTGAASLQTGRHADQLYEISRWVC